jgi:hypothetical protein
LKQTTNQCWLKPIQSHISLGLLVESHGFWWLHPHEFPWRPVRDSTGSKTLQMLETQLSHGAGGVAPNGTRNRCW